MFAGLKFSHVFAYNTLKNTRISLQKKLERQPFGTVQDMGNGKIRKLFTDDTDQVEILLAHAIPEGMANLSMALVMLPAGTVFVKTVCQRLPTRCLCSVFRCRC